MQGGSVFNYLYQPILLLITLYIEVLGIILDTQCVSISIHVHVYTVGSKTTCYNIRNVTLHLLLFNTGYGKPKYFSGPLHALYTHYV